MKAVATSDSAAGAVANLKQLALAQLKLIKGITIPTTSALFDGSTAIGALSGGRNMNATIAGMIDIANKEFALNATLDTQSAKQLGDGMAPEAGSGVKHLVSQILQERLHLRLKLV